VVDNLFFTARYIISLLEADKWFSADTDLGNPKDYKQAAINAVKAVVRDTLSGMERQEPDMFVYSDAVVITFGNAVMGDIQKVPKAEQLQIKFRKVGSRKIINIIYQIIKFGKKAEKTTAISSLNQLQAGIKKVYFDPECWVIRKRVSG
jgi:hypothetical protein